MSQSEQWGSKTAYGVTLQVYPEAHHLIVLPPRLLLWAYVWAAPGSCGASGRGGQGVPRPAPRNAATDAIVTSRGRTLVAPDRLVFDRGRHRKLHDLGHIGWTSSRACYAYGEHLVRRTSYATPSFSKVPLSSHRRDAVVDELPRHARRRSLSLAGRPAGSRDARWLEAQQRLTSTLLAAMPTRDLIAR